MSGFIKIERSSGEKGIQQLKKKSCRHFYGEPDVYFRVLENRVIEWE